MLIAERNLVRRWLLPLGRRLLTDVEQPTTSLTDAFYEGEADAFLRSSFTFRPPQRETSLSQIKSPTVVAPVQVEMPEIQGESDISRIIRSHNSSLYGLQGQVIVGRVVSVGQRDVLIDLGWKDFQTFMKSELTLSQIYRHRSEEKRNEGDFRPGDELRFRIEEVGTPHGEIFVSTEKMRADVRQRAIWNELRAALNKKTIVKGRVLNPSNAGYAVGVAGFVAFCPLNRLMPNNARKIGVLQDFLVDKMGEKVGANLIVVDPSNRFGIGRAGGKIPGRLIYESMNRLTRNL